jgi:predicted metal-dependent peptidase
MSEDEVRQCFSEAKEIMKQCGAKKLYLILHDMQVYYADEVSDDSLTKLKIARGGTSHLEVFELLEGKEITNYQGEKFKLPTEIEPELVVCFTDLGTCFPDKRPTYDVIWAVPSDGCPGPSVDVPFGEKVVVDMEAMRKSDRR